MTGAIDDGGAMHQEDCHVLALNCGSSSLKFGLYRVDSRDSLELFRGAVEDAGGRDGRLTARDVRSDRTPAVEEPVASLTDAIVRIRGLLLQFNLPTPHAIGHRIVHGGTALPQHVLIDERVSGLLAAAAHFAPSHAAMALSVMDLTQEYFPWTPQVACMDTAFHSGMPAVARTLPLPSYIRQAGVQRYGFHGLSCESILTQLGRPVPERLVIAHLGNGASVTAVRAGHSIDTSMGLTPTGGMLMGSRSGDLDPGVLIHLAREEGMDASTLEVLLNEHSGMLGISGLDSDVRTLRAASDSNGEARLALDMFCRSACRQIACMATALEGLDALVFTGGIGEHDAGMREAICKGLRWMGVHLDAQRNVAVQNPIHAIASPVTIVVLPSREQDIIARHTYDVFHDGQPSASLVCTGNP